jgi:pyruvate/2-oxoglutarate dehydrogenase complex dihydrolipoamide acyltransferase (E2) component
MAKPARKVTRAKKAASNPKADRTNKKADLIAMMKRAKRATLTEIMKANITIRNLGYLDGDAIVRYDPHGTASILFRGKTQYSGEASSCSG